MRSSAIKHLERPLALETILPAWFVRDVVCQRSCITRSQDRRSDERKHCRKTRRTLESIGRVLGRGLQVRRCDQVPVRFLARIDDEVLDMPTAVVFVAINLATAARFGIPRTRKMNPYLAHLPCQPLCRFAIASHTVAPLRVVEEEGQLETVKGHRPNVSADLRCRRIPRLARNHRLPSTYGLQPNVR